MNKQELIHLTRVKSAVALGAGLLVFLLTTISIIGSLLDPGTEMFPEEGLQMFRYFTILSNSFACIASAAMIPFAVEGLRKKRYAPPRWAFCLEYNAVICVSITLLICAVIGTPTIGTVIFERWGFFLHLLCPLANILLFFLNESSIILKRKDGVFGVLLFLAYTTVYLIMVFAVSEGGWRDMYQVGSLAGPNLLVAIPLAIAIGIAVAWLLAASHNRLVKRAESQLRHSIVVSNKDDPVALRIEAYSLGEYMGRRAGGGELAVPMDILRVLDEYSDQVSLAQLTAAYVTGALHALTDEGRSARG